MKFGQLLEHNMRNIFVGNDIWWETSSKIKIEQISGSTV